MCLHLASTCCKHGVSLQTCQEDLALQDVEVIVNPTSTMLQTDQGVSKAIASAGGPTFLDSCNEILAASLGQLSRGDTAVTMMPATAAHGLKCRCVVHAVMPQRTGKMPFVLLSTTLGY